MGKLNAQSVLLDRKSIVKAAVAVGVVALATSPAFAAIDVSAATSSILTDGTASQTSIGTVLIELAGVGLVFRWAKGALF